MKVSSVNLQLWLHPEQTHHFLRHLFSQLEKNASKVLVFHNPIRKAQVLVEVLELKAATFWCENNSIPNTSADLLDSSFLPRWTIDQDQNIKQLDKIKVLCVKNTVMYTCNQYRCMIFCSRKNKVALFQIHLDILSPSCLDVSLLLL